MPSHFKAVDIVEFSFGIPQEENGELPDPKDVCGSMYVPVDPILWLKDMRKAIKDGDGVFIKVRAWANERVQITIEPGARSSEDVFGFTTDLETLAKLKRVIDFVFQERSIENEADRPAAQK